MGRTGPGFFDEHTGGIVAPERHGVTAGQLQRFLDDNGFMFASGLAYSLVGGTDCWTHDKGRFTVSDCRLNRLRVYRWQDVLEHDAVREAEVDNLRSIAQSGYDKLRAAAEAKEPVTLTGMEAAVISDLVTQHVAGIQAAL